MPSDADIFRKKATRSYRCVCTLLVLFVIAATVAGWHFGAWFGLIIAGLFALLVAGVCWFAATLIWVMTQDGA